MATSERADGVPSLEGRCISIVVGGALYGVPMDDVQEVIGTRPLTRVFHASPAVAGVMSLRGEILPVVDVALVLGASEPTLRDGRDTRIVVVRESAGARRRAGLLVDSLGGIRAIGERGLAEVPATVSHPARDFVVGVIAEPPPCAVIDVSALLDAPSIAELSEHGDEP